MVRPGGRRPGAPAWAQAALSVAVAGGAFIGGAGPARAVAPTAPLVAGASHAPSPSAEADPEAPRVIITRFDDAQMRVALTFDACATKTKGYGFDRGIYETLRREKVPATFFTSGRWVEMHPDVMAELATNPLIEFGNHSYDHPHMTRISAARIDAELDQTEAALARFGKRSVAFRPPYGEFSARLIDVVHAHGMPAVLWDVVSGDPSKATTTSGIIDVVKRETRGGSIIIFHINGRGWKTAEALPTVLHDLRARGFQLVSLSSLLGPMAAPATTAPAPPSRGPHVATVAPAGPATARFAAPGPVPCEVPAPGERIVAGAGAEAAVGEEAWTP